jgi:hypothetical protein
MLAWMFSSRATATKEAALVQFQQESRTAIAQADARAAEANGRAAEADGRVAEARERAAGASADAAAAAERAETLEVEAARQRERAAIAERRLLELRQHATPRHLTSAQREELIALLGAAQPRGFVTVGSTFGDSEANAFAVEIRDTLLAANWPTGSLEPVAFLPREPIGLELHVKTGERPPAYADVLGRVFEAAGLRLEKREMPNLDANTVRVTVGARPPLRPEP